MAKQQKITPRSKDEIDKKYRQLWLNATGLSNATDNNLDTFNYNASDLSTQQLFEPIETEQVQLDNTDSYLTKVGKMFTANPVSTRHLDDGRSYKQGKLSDLTNSIYDINNTILNGFLYANIGDIQLEREEQKNLLLQRDYLLNLKDLNKAYQQIENAIHSGDREKMMQATEEWQMYKQIDNNLKSDFYAKNNWIFTNAYSGKDADERLNDISKRLQKLDEDINTNINDMHFWQDIVNKQNSIYMPDPEWEKKKKEDIAYRIPEALASSIPSLIGQFASIGAASATSALVGSSAGPIGAGAGAFVGLTSSVANSIISRNQESLQEVTSKYQSDIYNYLNQVGIPLSTITNDSVRKQLEELTGRDYANASDEEVLNAMMAYDLDMQLPELNNVARNTKKQLNNVYMRNMAMLPVDVAQSFLMIPSFGKYLNKLTYLNIGEAGSNILYKTLDKTLDWALRKAKISPKKIAATSATMKYVVEPIYRLGASAILEGGEEATQYIISNSKSSEQLNWSDFPKLIMQNNYAMFKGLAGVMGISGDPALDNSDELKESFYLGAIVSTIFGGGIQTYESVKNYRGYQAGRQLAKQMLTDHIESKEDVYKYIQYGNKAMSRMVNQEAMLDAIDAQINENFLPEGWTKEDLQKEKQNINKIFDLVNHNNFIKSFKKEDRPIAAALLQHNIDLYNRTVKASKEIFNENDIVQIQNAVNDLIQSNPELKDIDSQLITNYFINKYSLQSNKNQQNIFKQANDVTSNESMHDLLDELVMDEVDLQKNEKIINSLLSENAKKILDESTLSGYVKSIEDQYIKRFLTSRALKEAKKQLDSLSTNKNTMKSAITKYKESIVDDSEEAVNQEQVTEDRIDDDSPAQDIPDIIILEESTALEPQTEQKTDDNDKTNVVPVTAPVQPTSEPETNQSNQQSENDASKENNIQGILEQFNTEQPSGDYTDLIDDELNESDFTNDELSNPESNNQNNTDNPQIEKDNNESQNDTGNDQQDNLDGFDLSSFVTSAPNIPENTNQEDSPTRQIPQPINDQVDSTPAINDNTPQDKVDKIIKGNDQYTDQNQIIEINEGTLYYSFNDTPMFSGYETGNALNEFLSTPGNLEKSIVTAFVGQPDSKYGVYNPQDVSTWDNAAIYVEIISPDGKKYIATLKTIEGARALRISRGQEFTSEEENNLRTLRNTVIDIKLSNPNSTIIFEHVRMTNGILNKNRRTATLPNGQTYQQAINRNLQEVKGLGLPKDLHNLLDGDIAFAYGEGIRNGFKIAIIHNDLGKTYDLSMSLNAQTIDGGFGNLFIIPSATSNPSGLQNSVIKLNEKRFKDEDESLIDLAAQAVLFSRTRTGLDTAPLRKVLIFTDWERISEDDPRFNILGDKQIKLFNNDNGIPMLQLGTTVRSLSEMQNDAGLQEVKDFILQNSHWSMDKDALKTPLRDLFTQYFLEDYRNMDVNTIPNEIKLAEGFVLTLNDLGLKKDKNNWRNPLQPIEGDPGYTVLEWMIKNGKIQSDLQDQIYTSPFVYVGNPTIRINTTDQQQSLKIASEDPINPTPDTKINDTVSDEVQTNIDELFYGDGMDITNLGATKISNKNQLANAKKINTKKAIKWFKTKLGLTNEQVIITDGIIREFANGSAVYGVCNADCINISNMAVEGVQYHEAWHRVSLLMLTPEMRINLYEEFRKQHPQYRNTSDKIVEEALADNFMEYMLNDKQSAFRYYINKIFRDILKFIGLNKKINPRNLNSIFEAIKYGDFSKYKLNQESLDAFRKAYIANEVYYKVGKNKNYQPNHFPTLADFHRTANALKSCLLIANGTKFISDISKLNVGTLQSMLQGLINSNRLTTQQKDSINEIIEHFDDWMFELRPMLEQLGIRQIEDDFEEREYSGIQNYDKAAYEFSKKDNALGVVKLFFSTIPEYYYDYQQTEHGVVKKMMMRKDPITGLPTVYDYDTIASKILNKLSSVETYAPVPGEDQNKSLIGLCATLSKEDAVFAALYARLNKVKDSNLETQILQTIKSANLNPIEVGYNADINGKGTFYVKDVVLKDSVRQLPTSWSSIFFNSQFVKQSNEGISVNEKLLSSAINEYNKLVQDIFKNRQTLTDTQIDIYRDELTKQLNSIGIQIDSDAIEELLKGNRKVNLVKLVSRTNAKDISSISEIFNGILTNLLNNKNQQLDTIYNKRNSQHIINILAYAQSVANPSNSSLSILGPNNNVFYLKTQNNYCSDIIRRLNNKDEKTLVGLNNDLYCKSSLILATVNQNKPVRLNTFINFYGNNSGDKGREYLGLSEVEDYLVKMTLTWNNHIIFPTMADKKTWNTISGVTLFNKQFDITDHNGILNLKFNREALDYMYMAWKDEFESIVQYWKSLPNIEYPIKNYHTSNKGGKFRHFTGYYETVNGVKTYVDLNKIIDQAIKNNTVLKTLENIRQDLFAEGRIESTENKINNNLFLELQNELNTAVELGLINIDENNSKKLTNNLLDQKVFNEIKSWYENSTINAVKNNSERYAILTMLGNHMLNTNVSKLEIEKIITGDLAYYKNTDDQIKRLSSVLSTGDNLRTSWITNDSERIAEYRKLNSRQTYNCAIFNDNEIPSHQYDTIKDLFNYANARNLLKEKENLSEAEVDELMKNQDEAKTKYPFIFELSEKMAAADASAYGLNSKGTKGNINQADAAVYIRPQMYKDVIRMLGEWSDEVSKAYDILESANDWLSDPVLYKESLQTLIKALKTTYFGYRYDDNLQHNVPVFNKMAMFPMFKVLATGDNREIYDRMNAIGKYEGLTPIDQIAFESAVKVGIEGGKSFYKDYRNDSINNLSDVHITVQEFRNLRRQLITDPHHSERTLFGTQVSTVAVSNLIPDRLYGEDKPIEQQRTGEQIKEQLFGTINAISNKGASEVREMFLTDGNLDWGKTSMALVYRAKSANMGRDFIDAIAVNDSKTGFKVPLAALPDNKWVENTIISLSNKKAVDLELPGGAFIQMSSFGFKQIGVESSRLLNIRDDGSMDSIISINLFSHVIPDYENKTFTEAREWLIKHNLIGDNAKPVAMGYRIPTQGLSSIAALHIKDVLPSNVGDMIVLPDEFTAQTGSDFDIDKLFIARYNFDKEGNKINFKRSNENESFEDYLHRRYIEEMGGSFEVSDEGYEATIRLYNNWLNELGNPTNVYEANSREANENLLLDTYILVLTDKKNVTETRLPLDKTTGIIKDEILPIVDGNVKENVQPIPFFEMSPTFQMNKKYEYSGGKTGIGPFALNNKNHVLTQLTNLKFKSNDLLRALDFSGLDGIKSQNELVYSRDNKGNVLFDNDNNPITIEEEGLNILDWISAMINAHVDVAKDPYVIRLNVNQYTYNICNLLLRVGYGKNTFYFLPQAILKEMGLAYKKANGIYGVKQGSKTSIINQEIFKIRKKYYNLYVEYSNKASRQINFDFSADGKLIDRSGNKIESYVDIMARDELIKNIQHGHNLGKLNDSQLADFYLNQLKYSELFLALNDIAQEMSKLVQLSQVDTKRYGGNFIEQDRFLYRLKSFIANTQYFVRSDIENYYANTFLLTKLINGILQPSEIFQDLMLRSKQNFKNCVTNILTLVRKDNVNDEALNKTISNELEGQIRWQFLATIPNFNLFGMLYGSNSMSQRLYNIKNDILSGKYPELLTVDNKISNKLLDHLTSLSRFSTDNYFAPSIIATNRIDTNDKYLKQDLKLYWQELLESHYDEIRNFATDLIYYELATTAGNFTKNGIWQMLPTDALLSTGYAQFIDNAVNNFTEADINYDNFFLNNWQNNKIVPVVETKMQYFDTDMNEMATRDAFPILYGSVKINNQQREVPIAIQPNLFSIGRNKNLQNIYTPYIKVIVDKTTPQGTLLYKFVGTVLDVRGKHKPIYLITNKKGLNNNGRVVKEYDHYSNSLFSFNNIDGALLANQTNSIDAIFDVINKLGGKDKNNWINDVMSYFSFVSDYLPITQAQNVEIRSFGLYNAKEQINQVTDVEYSVEEQINAEQQEPSIFKFKDGTKIQIPFKLNEQQIKALLILEDFVNNSKKYNNVITLSGYAGTGKSTLISIFDKYLKMHHISPVYSSPTHRANAVTQMNNPEANVSTLHSLFGLSPVIDLTDNIYDLRKLKNEQRFKPKLKDNKILIIDESSMISKALYKLIEQYKNEHNVKVIYVGDQAQLSPVNDDSISPVFTGNQTRIQLTKVERTGDNAILAESTRLRNGEDFSYETRDNVEFTNSTDRANEIIDAIINSEEFKNNPLYFRILSATNDMISDANNRVRKILFGDNPNQVEIDDIMMGYNNISASNGQEGRIISNSIDYIVTQVGEKETNRIGGISVSGWKIAIKEVNNDNEQQVFVLDNKTSNEKLQQLSDYYQSINTQISQAFIEHNYNIIDDLYNLKADFEANVVLMRDYIGSNNRLLLRKSLDYGYAHTIHKSQGGTYNNVLIYADTIDRFNDPQIRQQLKYVAMSRAKDNVTVLTNHPTTDSRKVINTQNIVINYDHNWTRKEVENQKDKLFIFTDNTDRDSGSTLIDPNSEYAQKYGKDKHYPSQTQAVIRGLNNAMPISTQRWYHEGAKGKSGQWTDDAFNEFKTIIDNEIEDIKRKWDTGRYKQLVFGIENALFSGSISEITQSRVPNIYNYLQQKYQELLDYVGYTRQETVPESIEMVTSTNPKDYKLYSGGAVGSDTEWANVAKQYGIGRTINYRPETLDILTPEQTQEVETAYIASANKLGRKILEANTYAGKLVRRDYLQAKAADSIFAIGHILKPGEKNSKGFTINSITDSVDGGTGYAVQMGMDLCKPIHVYDQTSKQWYKFDYSNSQFISEDTPVLTTNFAGIGTRKINQYGKDAIKSVFQKTFGSAQTQAEQTNTINIWYSSNENADLSNFAIRPFIYNGTKFDSVEQAFQFAKLNFAADTRNNQIIGNIILLEKNGAQLKKFGNKIEQLDSKSWDANSSRIMKELIKASFEQNEIAKQRLLSTGDIALTHKQDKGKWGTEFPKLLMEVRSELNNSDIEVVNKSISINLTEFNTFDENETQLNSDMEQMNRDGEQIKNYCKGE